MARGRAVHPSPTSSIGAPNWFFASEATHLDVTSRTDRLWVVTSTSAACSRPTLAGRVAAASGRASISRWSSIGADRLGTMAVSGAAETCFEAAFAAPLIDVQAEEV